MNNNDDVVGDRGSGVDEGFAIVPECEVVLAYVSIIA